MIRLLFHRSFLFSLKASFFSWIFPFSSGRNLLLAEPFLSCFVFYFIFSLNATFLSSISFFFFFSETILLSAKTSLSIFIFHFMDFPFSSEDQLFPLEFFFFLQEEVLAKQFPSCFVYFFLFSFWKPAISPEISLFFSEKFFLFSCVFYFLVVYIFLKASFSPGIFFF